MPYTSIYAGQNATKIPNSGNKANPFADDFKPGQYARKPQDQPKPKQVKVTQPKPAPQPQYKSLFSKITSGAKSAGKAAESAGKAVARPVADIATGKGGKAVHDTAQLTADVTGNTVNQFAKGVKYTPQMVAADVTNNANAQANTQKKAFGTTKSSDIAKKIIGSTVGSAAMLAGGGEAAGAKSLLRGGIKKLAPKVIRDANIGGAGNVGMTLTNHPEASQKEIGKSLAEGMALGGAAPAAGKLIGKGVSSAAEKSGIGATKDLVRNTQTKSLLDRSRQPTTVATPVDTATTKSINTIMSKIRTPAKVMAERKAEGEAQVANQKETQKTTETNQKLDDKIELINAKKADDKFTNVDKVKVKQLEGQKTPVAGEAKAPAIPNLPGAKTPYDTPEIIAARVQQEKIPSTHLDNSPERQALRAKTLRILDKQGGHANPANAPAKVATGKRADIVLGMPGSGKTNLVDPLLKEHSSRLIDNDEAKKLLGDTNFSGALHQESDDITNDLLKKSVTSGENVVMPMVGKTASKIEGIIDELKHQGYEVHGHYMHVTPETAAKRVVSRFNETGKFVDPDYVVNQVGLHPSKTYDILKEHEGLHSLQAHTNEVPLGQPHQLIEKRGLLEKSNSTGRPQGKLDAKRPEVSAKTPQKSLKVSNSSKRKEYKYDPSKPEPVSVAYEQPKTNYPKIGQSKLASSTEQKAIDKKLTQGFEGKPEYAKVDTKLQAAHATELLKTNPEQAERIALGHELPPNDLLPESVYIAVENKALKDGNVDLLRRLATEGSLSSEATGLGQRIRMLGERDPDSVVSAMRKLADTRKKVAERRLGKPVAKAVSDTVKQIKVAKPKVTKESFQSFVESLKC